MKANDRDLELLFELGTMRHIERSWRQFGGAHLANVAEHSYRVIWIALVLAKAEGADIGKVVKMAMIHDLPETRTGDANYVQREYVSSDEKSAMMDILAGTSVAEELRDLWSEYRERQSVEAKIVKDADNLDCDLELQEIRTTGSNLADALAETRQSVFENLHTDSAKRLFLRIQQANSHDWHTRGRNRLNSGDWRRQAAGE